MRHFLSAVIFGFYCYARTCSHRLVGFRFVCLCPSMQFQMTSLWMHMPDTPPSCLLSTCQPPNFMYLNSSFSSFVLSFPLFLNSTKAVMGYFYASVATADLDGLVWNEGSNLVPSQLPQLLRQHFCCPRGQSVHVRTVHAAVLFKPDSYQKGYKYCICTVIHILWERRRRWRHFNLSTQNTVS
jgi:hypothetical protein